MKKQLLGGLGWVPILCICGDYYPDLVREFYANMAPKMDKDLQTIISTIKRTRIVLTREYLAAILEIREEGKTVTVDSNKKTIDEDPTWSFNAICSRFGIWQHPLDRRCILHWVLILQGKENYPQGRCTSSHSLHLTITATPRMKRRKFGSLHLGRTGCRSDDESYDLSGENDPSTAPMAAFQNEMQTNFERLLVTQDIYGAQLVDIMESAHRYADELAHHRASIYRKVILARLWKKFIPDESSSAGGEAIAVVDIFGLPYVFYMLIPSFFGGFKGLQRRTDENDLKRSENNGKRRQTVTTRKPTVDGRHSTASGRHIGNKEFSGRRLLRFRAATDIEDRDLPSTRTRFEGLQEESRIETTNLDFGRVTRETSLGAVRDRNSAFEFTPKPSFPSLEVRFHFTHTMGKGARSNTSTGGCQPNGGRNARGRGGQLPGHSMAVAHAAVMPSVASHEHAQSFQLSSSAFQSLSPIFQS
ncbi:hypothetical protein M9H77_23284 [Catharanthus roseus]|uniref:Uncharacterized protein n=1 Tax=Catharanthus roseus TaxID=4058 RepID=A0ACC0AWW6_CATRO|nr:hypothetical protein M9H77_23284 [Catharanthus roseus]